MKPPVAVGDHCTLDVTGLNHQGEGIGRVHGFAVFVPKAIPGDQADVEIISIKKQYGRALIRQIRHPSPYRVQPPCPVAERCGGCQLQHVDYSCQLELKQSLVVDALDRIGGVKQPIEPVVGMDYPWQYRNKGQFPVAGETGSPRIGFFAPRSHEVVTFDRCLVQPDAINETLDIIKTGAARFSVAPYSEDSHTGELRHVVIRSARNGAERMVILVSRSDNLIRNKEFLGYLTEEVPDLKVLAWNKNSQQTNAIFGSHTEILAGTNAIVERIDDLEFFISPRSFFQTNTLQTQVLYEEVRLAVEAGPRDVVWDLHCGIGTIGLYAARDAGKLVGVELITEAVDDARRNANHNGISADFVQGHAEDVIAGLSDFPDTVILDPPRKGCDSRLLRQLAEKKAARIVYVSCNPATLARDVKFLAENGYTVQRVQPVDMFPHTVHVECVVVLER